jgi:hypothetical protein
MEDGSLCARRVRRTVRRTIRRTARVSGPAVAFSGRSPLLLPPQLLVLVPLALSLRSVCVLVLLTNLRSRPERRLPNLAHRRALPLELPCGAAHGRACASTPPLSLCLNLTIASTKRHGLRQLLKCKDSPSSVQAASPARMNSRPFPCDLRACVASRVSGTCYALYGRRLRRRHSVARCSSDGVLDVVS